MHIVELRAENVKRLRAVHIRPDGSLVLISGKNGAGKSSVLDAIQMALAGTRAHPRKPVRDGCDHADIFIDLGDLLVKRTFTSDDRTYLSVESRDGAKFPTPQAILDRLVGELTFDPFAFARMKPADQLGTLKKLAGVDFSELDRQRQLVFDKRTLINRDLRTHEGELQNMPIVAAPDQEIVIGDLAKRNAEAIASVRAQEARRSQLEQVAHNINRNESRIKELLDQIDRIERYQSELRTELEQLTSAVNSFVQPDVEALQKQLESAEETNRAVRAKRARAVKSDLASSARKQSDELTEQIETIDQQKRELVMSARMPIEGLGFTDDGISFNGIPFEQASSAEQLRVSVAMGLALNPKLRVMLIRDGSLLDADSMKLLGEVAEANNAQVWVERVSDGEPVGVVIEDGEVAAPAVAQ